MYALLKGPKSEVELTPPYQPALESKVLDYEERVIKWHSVGVKRNALFYRFRSPSDEEDCKVSMVPDACVNLLFACCPDNPGATLSGVQLRPVEVQLKPNMEYFGFKPYSDRGFKEGKLPLTSLVDSSVDLLELLPMAETLISGLMEAQAKGLLESMALFDAFAKKNLVESEYQPSFVDFFTLLLCSSGGMTDLEEMQRMTGYSKRYCRERFKADHGITPKQYSTIMRFQGTLKQLMRGGEGSLTSLAANNGYFDQAHFIHDFRHFTNQSPSRFRKEHLIIGA
ncbi:MAG: helix-turn-helix domain-containing protein [Coriobacteriia bacterium]|nr:helix-turn-helix domain-containing protein [Coriobacteriia bacterium]